MARMTPEPKPKVFLGRVGVDSGTLLIVDPSYIDDEWNKSITYKDLSSQVRAYGVGGPINGTFPNFGVGVRPNGDGGYPVWGYVAEDGTLERVEIDFRADEQADDNR